jgi:hypothetical protein
VSCALCAIALCAGLTLFARAALFGQSVDAYLTGVSAGDVTLQTALSRFPEWTAQHNGRGFAVDEIPQIIGWATGIDVTDLFQKFVGNYVS